MARFLFLLLFLCGLHLRAELSEAEEGRARNLYKFVFEPVPPKGFDPSRLRNLLGEEQELLRRWMKGVVESRIASGSTTVKSDWGLEMAIVGNEWGSM